MKKTVLLSTLILLATVSLFSQNARRQAEHHPLDAAFYLLAKDENRANGELLTRTLFEVGRYPDALRAIEAEDNSYTKFMRLSFYGRRLIEENKRREAGLFLTKAFAVLRDEEEWAHEDRLDDFIVDLIRLERAPEALEVIKHQDEEDRPPLQLAAAEAFIEQGRLEKAGAMLPAALAAAQKNKDHTNGLRVALLYARAGQPDKAREILAAAEPAILSREIEDERERRRMLPAALAVYLQLGETERAFRLWNRAGAPNDLSEYSPFIRQLIVYGYRAQVLPLLARMRFEKEEFARSGHEIVEAYLKIGDVNSALAAAREMSDEPDAYWQQTALMAVADRFIADGDQTAALNVLNFAFERARPIVFAHEPQQSNGASAGTRKVIYLRGIYERLMKLRQYEKARAALDAVGSDHRIARQFLYNGLMDFAGRQLKTLPRAKIAQLLDEAQKLVKGDDEYQTMESKLRAAEIHTQLGEKRRAVGLLAEVLTLAKASCCYEDDFLIAAGKVFEERGLKADERLKKVLREYLGKTE